jgi:hypothetical protein
VTTAMDKEQTKHIMDVMLIICFSVAILAIVGFVALMNGGPAPLW